MRVWIGQESDPRRGATRPPLTELTSAEGRDTDTMLFKFKHNAAKLSRITVLSCKRASNKNVMKPF